MLTIVLLGNSMSHSTMIPAPSTSNRAASNSGLTKPRAGTSILYARVDLEGLLLLSRGERGDLEL